MVAHIFYLILGFAILIAGGEFLVRGAVGIAKRFNISTLVIGMTVVSFGTSAPELIVSIKAALNNYPEIAIGNVIGSNISNIGLVLAITVLIFPIVIDRNTIRIDWPMMMGASILLYFFMLDGALVFWEGAVMLSILIAFTFWLVRNSRKKNDRSQDKKEGEENSSSMGRTLFYFLIGLSGLFFGSEFLLKGAVYLADEVFKIEKRVIAVTVVAFGTSVPELVASSVAAYRKQTDISIGNLIGSNLFNIMVVLGVTSMVKTTNVDDTVMSQDIYWMLFISLLLLPMMLIGKKFGRVKGGILLSMYISYIVFVLKSIL